MAGSTNQGYIAARFYGMRSRLLKNEDYQRLLTSTDIHALISDLRNLPTYKTVLEERLLLEDPLTAIDSAINIVLSERIKKTLRLSGGPFKRGFKLLSLKWELANVQLAIRSILKQIEYQPYFIPLGDLNQNELTYLTNCSDLNEALSYLESILNPLAHVVRQLIDKNVLPNDFETIDGIFNLFYQNQLRKGVKNIKDRKIIPIMKKSVKEEREFQNTKTILNYLGKIARGTTFDVPDFSLMIFPGKAIITPEEIEIAVRNKDVRTLQSILLRTSYKEIIQQMIEETGSSRSMQRYVEEVEKKYYPSQTRKRFLRHSFNLGLAYIWQITTEARNLRILAHGLNNYTQDEISRRLFFA